MRTNLSASVNQVHVDIAKYGTNYFCKTVIQESPFVLGFYQKVLIPTVLLE